MSNINYKIIMPTTTNYLDISLNFIELLRINWPDAFQNVILSVAGELKSNKNVFRQVKIVENEKGSSLPECVYNASQRYEADLYIIFLGDAFITKKVDCSKVINLLNSLIEHKIQYCRLLPQLYLKKSPFENHLFRYITSNERYSHSFVAFIATRAFIDSEFSDGKTDRDFELKYLKIASEKRNYTYKDRVILKKNIFHILPSIQKGKWDLLNYWYLQYRYPTVQLSNKREKINICFEIVLYARKLMLPFVSDNFRMKIKQLLQNTNYFDTKI